tara:strand:+ start:54 stop:347 length:294 start_codon:yes stop_codon:yes gene_type:complete
LRSICWSDEKISKGGQKSKFKIATSKKKVEVLMANYSRKSKKASSKSKGSKICPEGKAWAQRTFDTYPSAYANLAASKYCKDPNYAKKSKGGKRKGR